VSKAVDLRQLADEDLERSLAEARAELFNLRFQLVTGQVSDTSRIRALRREVARILTIQRERELMSLPGGEQQ
jgi:large subunit ribosomal protein L29